MQADIVHRIAGPLNNTDLTMKNSFWVGVYPGLTDEMIDYMLDVFARFFKSFGSSSNVAAV